jgi:hypothetical protein
MSENRRLLHQMVRPFLPEEDDCPARLRLGLAMMDAGLEMMRLSLQRLHPEDGPQEIRERLYKWLLDQPPAPGLTPIASHRFRLDSVS